MHLRIRLFPLWQQSLTILVLLLMEKLISLWVIGAVAQPTPPLTYWAPPLVGMLLWPWIYIILRDLRRKFQVS
jgi:rod shape-determining protein MreD